MNVAHQFQSAIAAGDPLNWQMLRDQLDQEHASSQTAGERESLLALFKTLMDMVERIDITPDIATSFRAERQKSYHRLVLREASVGGCFCLQRLDEITTREVKAGRMPGDDPLRETAILGVVALCTSPLEAPAPAGNRSSNPGPNGARSGSGWHRVLAWFGRRSRRPIDALQ